MIGYMITDSDGHYIRRDQGTNRYVPIAGQRRGDVWPEKKKANNIFSCLPRELRSRYHVIQVDVDNMPAVQSDQNAETESQSTAHVAYELVEREPETQSCTELIAELEKVCENPLRNFEKWKDRVQDVVSFIDDANARMNELRNELTNSDRAISDLLHYMEFNQLNAYQGYIAYRKAHEELLRRREIKNETKVMHAILQYAPASSDFAHVLKAINNMDTQRYKPRVLNDLFK